MAERRAKKQKMDLRQNKANVMLKKAVEGGYGIPGVCVVRLPGPNGGHRSAQLHPPPINPYPTLVLSPIFLTDKPVDEKVQH